MWIDELKATSMDFYTVDETARMLKVSSMTVRRHISTGRLSAVRVGRSVRIERTAVDAFVQPLVVPTDLHYVSPATEYLTFDDPLGGIVGMIHDDGPTDVAENHDRYLADAYADCHDDWLCP